MQLRERKKDFCFSLFKVDKDEEDEKRK